MIGLEKGEVGSIDTVEESPIFYRSTEYAIVI